jgi:hypothetical protein
MYAEVKSPFKYDPFSMIFYRHRVPVGPDVYLGGDTLAVLMSESFRFKRLQVFMRTEKVPESDEYTEYIRIAEDIQQYSNKHFKLNKFYMNTLDRKIFKSDKDTDMKEITRSSEDFTKFVIQYVSGAKSDMPKEEFNCLIRKYIPSDAVFDETSGMIVLDGFAFDLTEFSRVIGWPSEKFHI